VLSEHENLILYLRQRRYTKRTLGEDRNAPKRKSTMDIWRTLQFVTLALSQTPESRDIDLFGSAARQLREFTGDTGNFFSDNPRPEDFEFTGDDFDLVVTVSPRVYDLWNKRLNRHLDCTVDCNTPSDDPYGCKWFRFNLAIELLGGGTYKGMEPLYGWLYTLDEIAELDVHLMPEDWRSRTTDLQDDLPHRDPLFVSNIARDAVRLTEIDTRDIIAWQLEIIKRVAQIQQVRQSIGRSAVISATISHGLTHAGMAAQD
jgi:hypothetical protein